MKDILLFLKSKVFGINVIAAIAVIILGFWGTLKWLDNYTKHGFTLEVPDLYGVSVPEAKNLLAQKNLKYEIIDSIFESSVEGGVVVRQDPATAELVKENRTIYLTVSAKRPPLVPMPQLIDASMRQALSLMGSVGLKPGKRTFKRDACVNCVLEQMHNGKTLKEGELIPRGSVIDVILGKGEQDEKLGMPCLYKTPYEEAAIILAESGFAEGGVICRSCESENDRNTAKVVRQDPPCGSDAVYSAGTPVYLYLSTKSIITAADTSREE